MVEGIDRAKMMELFGDADFVEEVISQVATDSLAALERMKGQLATEDYKNYIIDAHGIKGMMASIYYEPLRAWAKEHEFAGKEGRIDYIKEDFDKFSAEVTAFCKEVLEG